MKEEAIDNETTAVPFDHIREELQRAWDEKEGQMCWRVLEYYLEQLAGAYAPSAALQRSWEVAG